MLTSIHMLILAGLAEFSYALNRKGAHKLVAVVMEEGLRDTAQWQGVVGLRLGMWLYVRTYLLLRSGTFTYAVYVCLFSLIFALQFAYIVVNVRSKESRQPCWPRP